MGGERERYKEIHMCVSVCVRKIIERVRKKSYIGTGNEGGQSQTASSDSDVFAFLDSLSSRFIDQLIMMKL